MFQLKVKTLYSMQIAFAATLKMSFSFSRAVTMQSITLIVSYISLTPMSKQLRIAKRLKMLSGQQERRKNATFLLPFLFSSEFQSICDFCESGIGYFQKLLQEIKVIQISVPFYPFQLHFIKPLGQQIQPGIRATETCLV